ncbi:MAG: CAP domain-containing protein [Saccharofermentans sp.]|nr:CAP domain-containing protein [Saccharofermentans sp.]
MSENDFKPKNDLKDIAKEDRLPLFLVIFTVFVLASQWAYSYYVADPLKFPWGKLTYNVSDDNIELLDYELANYLGARAAQDEANEYVYRAVDINLIAAGGFSIRTGPGVYYQSIGRMYYGREVHVIAISEDNDWYMIEFDGQEAYVHRACLFEVLPEPYDFVPTSTEVVRLEEELPEETEEVEATEPTETTPLEGSQEATLTPTPAGPTNTPTPTPTPAPVSIAAPSDPTMLELFNLVNNARTAAGLQPLSWSNGLASAAMTRAQEITVSFSHTRPDGSQWWTVNSNIMYGENLAGGQSTAQEVFNSWWNSPGHKANMMNPDFRTCGFALYYSGDAGMTYY